MPAVGMAGVLAHCPFRAKASLGAEKLAPIRRLVSCGAAQSAKLRSPAA